MLLKTADGQKTSAHDYPYCRQEFYVRFKGPEESMLDISGIGCCWLTGCLSTVQRRPVEGPCGVTRPVSIQKS